jgi:glucose-1-phosphate adenylyltransferase
MRGGASQQDAARMERVTAVVLAGGQGTRLFPLTESRCKPAVTFGGRYRLIDVPLSNSLNAHIRRIFVISQYFASDLHHHIASTYPHDLFQKGGIEMLCPEEVPHKRVWFKGTADAVRQNLSHLLKTPADYFLILSGDQLYNMDFAALIECAERQDADLVIAALPVEEREAKRMGVMKIDSGGRVVDFIEKPGTHELLRPFQTEQAWLQRRKLKHPERPHFLGSMGIYVFKRDAMVALLQEEGDDFGRNLIPIQVKRGKTAAFLFDGYWEDIGTVASYYEANLALTEDAAGLNTYDESNPIYACPHHLPSPMIRNTTVTHSLISQGAIIEAAEISRSVIGVRAHIKQGTIIRDSIVMGNHFYRPPAHQNPPLPAQFSIGEECVIEKAIIDEHTCIGDRVRLINRNQLQKYDGDGVYIRDGIIIVTSGTRLPDDFTL